MIRYKKTTKKFDTYFLTGTDEHGQKIQEKAKSRRLRSEFVDKIISAFKIFGKKLDISYDDFIRTTQPRHTKAVQKILQKLDNDIYLGSTAIVQCQ